MIALVKVTAIKALDGNRLSLTFSDGSSGVFDVSHEIAKGGPMVEPLGDADFFARVFLDTGAPAWPNGYDLDPIALHQDMAAAGLLQRPNAA